MHTANKRDVKKSGQSPTGIKQNKKIETNRYYGPRYTPFYTLQYSIFKYDFVFELTNGGYLKVIKYKKKEYGVGWDTGHGKRYCDCSDNEQLVKKIEIEGGGWVELGSSDADIMIYEQRNMKGIPTGNYKLMVDGIEKMRKRVRYYIIGELKGHEV